MKDFLIVTGWNSDWFNQWLVVLTVTDVVVYMYLVQSFKSGGLGF